ncbi:MAG: hypothetical protein ABSE39_04665 [Candidatus Bathyarchaeia archaeon]
MSTPRESVRAAFVAILTAANLGVTIYDGLPFDGADTRSVVIRTVSGTSKSPGVGLRKSTTKRGFMAYYRLQLDINYDDRAGVTTLADQVEQAIMDAIDTLRTTYDIHGLRKMLDVDALPIGASVRIPILTREARVIMDFTFWTHRELTA